LFDVFSFAQTPQAEPRELDFGKVQEAIFLNSYLLIRNTGTKALILLRADAPPEFTVSAGKKIIPSRDNMMILRTQTIQTPRW
jgi:hypothetical protein